MRKFSWLIIIGTVIGIIVIAIVLQKSVQKQETIFIAGNIPLTGPIAMFCGQYHNGFLMGIEDACTEYNISREIFKLDFQDNAGNPANAATVMRKQLLFNPKIYISGTSAMSDAIIDEILTKGILHFLVAFDAFMTDNRPTVFRILPNFKIEAPVFIKFIDSVKKEENRKRVFFFTPNLKAYLEQSDQLIIPEVKKRGIQYKREFFEFEQKDFRSIVLKAMEFKPDIIVISGYAFHVYPIVKLLKEYKLHETSSIISTLDFVDLLHANYSREELKEIAFVSPECEIPNKIPIYEEWKKNFKKHFASDPSYVDAYAYDTARIIVKAFAKNKKIDTESILSVLPFDGVVGKIMLDNNRNLSSTLVIGFVNEKGLIEELK